MHRSPAQLNEQIIALFAMGVCVGRLQDHYPGSSFGWIARSQESQFSQCSYFPAQQSQVAASILMAGPNSSSPGMITLASMGMSTIPLVQFLHCMLNRPCPSQDVRDRGAI